MKNSLITLTLEEVNNLLVSGKLNRYVSPLITNYRCPMCGSIVLTEDNPGNDNSMSESCTNCRFTTNQFMSWEDISGMTIEDCKYFLAAIELMKDVEHNQIYYIMVPVIINGVKDYTTEYRNFNIDNVEHLDVLKIIVTMQCEKLCDFQGDYDLMDNIPQNKAIDKYIAYINGTTS